LKFLISANLLLLASTTGVLLAAPKIPNKTKVNPNDGATYIWIDPGTFTMGCSKDDRECFAWESSAEEQRVSKGFWIGRTEVTQSEYEKLTGENPSRYRGPRLPVDQISWFNARNYCQAIGMRLPTEKEWEYAARGGSSLPRYGPLNAIAWYDGNSADTTHVVAQKAPNGYGLYDTLGNVWEWVQDSADQYGKGMRLLRGASFYNIAKDVRVSDRLWAVPETAHRDMGVRCAGD
jgi:formylglycine-generating enzyme required for sulfatase activity